MIKYILFRIILLVVILSIAAVIVSCAECEASNLETENKPVDYETYQLMVAVRPLQTYLETTKYRINDHYRHN